MSWPSPGTHPKILSVLPPPRWLMPPKLLYSGRRNSLREHTVFLALVPPAEPSREKLSMTSKLLSCCCPIKFTDRIWHSHTRCTVRDARTGDSLEQQHRIGLRCFGLSLTMWEPSIRSTSNIVSLVHVSFVVVTVNVMDGVRGWTDRHSCRRDNQTLQAACLFVFDFPLELKITLFKLNDISSSKTLGFPS